MNEQDAKLISSFRQRLESGQLGDDVGVTYRLQGGAPGEQISEELNVPVGQAAHMTIRDEIHPTRSGEALVELDAKEVENLLAALGPSLEELTPASDAHFVPDSLVGSITINVGGETTTLYFLADEQEAAAQKVAITPSISQVLLQIHRVKDRIIQGDPHFHERMPGGDQPTHH